MDVCVYLNQYSVSTLKYGERERGGERNMYRSGILNYFSSIFHVVAADDDNHHHDGDDNDFFCNIFQHSFQPFVGQSFLMGGF